MKQAEVTRLKKPKLQGAKENIQAHIDYLTQHIKDLDKQIEALCDDDPLLKTSMEILESVPGVGLISAASLLSFLPELGKIGNKEIGALTGVVPYSKQSGHFKGVERISGGRPHPRRVLYMCALVGIRYNPVLKAYYETLCQKGKAKKVALVACMRKLIGILNTLLMRKEKWDPTRNRSERAPHSAVASSCDA